MAFIQIKETGSVDTLGRTQTKALVQTFTADDFSEDDLQALLKFCRDDEQFLLVIDGKHEVVWS